MHSDPMHRISRRGTICEPVIFGENIDQVGCCPSCTIWRDVPVLLGLLNHHFYGSISIVCTHYWRRTPENFGSFTYFYWKQSTVKNTISAYVTLSCLVDLTRFRRTLNFMDKRTDSVCSAGAFSSLTIRYFCSSKNLGLLSARFPLMINFRSAAGFDLREVQLRFSISPILTFRSYPWIWGPPRGSSVKYHINVTHGWFVTNAKLVYHQCLWLSCWLLWSQSQIFFLSTPRMCTVQSYLPVNPSKRLFYRLIAQAEMRFMFEYI